MHALAWLLWHPLHGDGYQFWSGVEGAAQQALEWLATIALAAGAYYRHHRCMHCRRIGRHKATIDGVTYPACRWHIDEDHAARARAGRARRWWRWA